MDNISGVINIYKEQGFTSHDVVNIVRKNLNRVKTGHTGTLDPDAEGVLPICVGKATKLADYIASDIKAYRAQMTLGITTTTEDSSGEVTGRSPVCSTEAEIREAIMSFVGEYSQKPPMYSAVKVNGKKLYELAREGKEIERKTRIVNIYDISEISFLGSDTVEMLVTCSKGTYIRTLLKDIGEKLGCGACMSALTRVRSGQFFLENSIKIDEFRDIVAQGKLDEVLMPMESVLKGYKRVKVSNAATKYLYNGNKISISYLSDKKLSDFEKVLVYDCDENLIGLYERNEGVIKPLTMLI